MRTTRRAFLTSVPAVLLPGAMARAQTGRAHRIGYLLNARPDLGSPLDQAFVEGLRELGYFVGRNVTLEHRSAGGDPRKLLAAAGELVRLQPDVIVGSSTFPQSLLVRADEVLR